MDFCPRCGCNLNGNETFCPECGNVLGGQVQNRTVSSHTSGEYILWFLLGLFAALGIIMLLGRMFFFLFIPIMFFGGGRSRSGMFFMGAMVGTMLGLLIGFFLALWRIEWVGLLTVTP